MSKRLRSRSPTPCAHDRPLKRSSVPPLAVGDGAREPPPLFTPPSAPSPSSPAQVQTLSALLFVQGPIQSSNIPATDADGNIQDEWVALTRNLTLLSARGPFEHEVVVSGSREEVMMSLDEPPQSSNLLLTQHFQHGGQISPGVHVDHSVLQLLNPRSDEPTTPVLPSSPVTSPHAVAFLRAPNLPTRPTPPLYTAPFPSHSLFSANRMGTPPLARHDVQQPQEPLPGPTRRFRFTMGPRPDCNKCRLGVPGHYAHFD